VSWQKFISLIEPHYSKGKMGRPPFPIATMLRIRFMQQWFSLSDPAMEEALHDIPLYREFVQLGNGMALLPDESTILRFRHLLEAHKPAAQMFAAVNDLLQAKGLTLKAGSAIDATLIQAPSSTKKPGTRDPEMRQTQKGGSWYFGMKPHIGEDAESGLVHTMVCTSANIDDVTVAHALLRGQETDLYADAGYQGLEERGETGTVRCHVAMRPSKRRKLDKTDCLEAIYDQIERLKASIRAKVEHPFRVLKRQFGYQKARYRGLAKNTAQVMTQFALVHLWMARKALKKA
jgi:IS5 family transposase